MPKNSAYYFNPASDDRFKAAHPVGYVFLVLLGLAVFFTPSIVYAAYIIPLAESGIVYNTWTVLLGFAGSLIIGVGFFNFVAIIIDQYLGHLVSILSFAVGGTMVVVSVLLL